jgi:hypothetical protein
MQISASPASIEELEGLKRGFGRREAVQIPNLIEKAISEPAFDPPALIRLHELLLFVRAYPHSRGVYSKAEQALQKFPDLVAALRAKASDLAGFEEAEVSGMAGTTISALFSFGTVLRLTQLYPSELDIDWDWYQDTGPMGRLLPRFLPLFGEVSAVDADVPHRKWLEAAVPRRARSLAWLLDRVASLNGAFWERAELYDSLRLIVKWKLSRSTARTCVRLPATDVYYHGSPLIQRREVSLQNLLAGPPLPVVLLPKTAGSRFLDLALTASAVRYRELHGFTFGDPAKVWRAEAGRGVQIYLAGILPQFRLPLRAYHAGMIIKNGVPVGYFEGLSLFENTELGFNLYHTFREGETAWLFAQLVHLLQQLLGVTLISIDPYQIGRNNEEAIESGAFWFYRKLGFRSVEPAQARMAAREEKRLLERPGYRTPHRILRTLAESPMLFEANGAPAGLWDRFHVRNLALAVQRRMAAKHGGDSSRIRHAAVGSVLRALRAERADASKSGCQNLALVLDLIPDLVEWSESEKTSLLRIIRAKDSADERRYLTLMRQHRRLKETLLRLGRAEVV